jgi:hypothetical protein
MQITPVAVFLVASAASAGPVTAVLPVQGVDDATATAVERSVRAEAMRSFGKDVQSADATLGHIAAAAGMGVTCPTAEPACLANLGVLSGIQRMVSTVVGADGKEITVRVIDVASARTSAEGKRRVGADVAQAAREAAILAMRPADALARLSLVGAPAGAQLLVDGEALGALPLAEADATLAPGAHTLRVELEGYLPFERAIEVAPFEQVNLEVQLASEAAPPVETPPATTDTPHPSVSPPAPAAASDDGLSILVLAGGVTAGAAALLSAGLIGGALVGESITHSGPQTPVPTRNAAQSTAAALWVGGIVASGVTAVGLGILLTGLVVE